MRAVKQKVRRRVRRNHYPGCEYAPNPSAGVRAFRRWHARPPEERIPVQFAPLSPELPVLGDVLEIVYRSDKWHKGRVHDYRHHFSASDPPAMLHDPANNMLLIAGGKMKITSEGIEG